MYQYYDSTISNLRRDQMSPLMIFFKYRQYIYIYIKILKLYVEERHNCSVYYACLAKKNIKQTSDGIFSRFNVNDSQ